jgi:hypothetical protein
MVPLRPGGIKKNTCDGGCVPISPPIAPPPAPYPPLGLLPEPHRARVTGVSSSYHEKVGGIWHLPRVVVVPPEQGLAADTTRRLPLQNRTDDLSRLYLSSLFAICCGINLEMQKFYHHHIPARKALEKLVRATNTLSEWVPFNGRDLFFYTGLNCHLGE